MNANYVKEMNQSLSTIFLCMIREHVDVEEEK